MSEQSKVIRCRDYRWRGVEVKRYKEETEESPFRDIHRQTLLGNEPGLAQETRYFEIAAGGYSALERHQHPHSVVILRGEGDVLLGEELVAVGLHDCVYVAPGTLHQFRASGDGPLGFLCVVDRERDRPRPASVEERRRLGP